MCNLDEILEFLETHGFYRLLVTASLFDYFVRIEPNTHNCMFKTQNMQITEVQKNESNYSVITKGKE